MPESRSAGEPRGGLTLGQVPLRPRRRSRVSPFRLAFTGD